MRSLYIASTQGGGGKTTIALGLALALRRRGLSVGYFKPVGTLAAQSGDLLLDEDATFVAGLLDLEEAPADICPVVLDEDALHDVLAGSDVDAMGRVGSLLSPDLRETGQGGLAATPTGVRIAERLAENDG